MATYYIEHTDVSSLLNEFTFSVFRSTSGRLFHIFSDALVNDRDARADDSLLGFAKRHWPSDLSCLVAFIRSTGF